MRIRGLSKARTVLSRVKRLVTATAGGAVSDAAAPGEVSDTAGGEVVHNLGYARAVLHNGTLPTDFSVGLGAAPCNHTCLFCPQSVEKPSRAVWLDSETLRKVLEELPEEKLRVNISSYSETVAAPNLLPAVRLIKQIRPKLPVIMASNGTLFREPIIAALIDAGLDHYSYSFDAANRHDYAAIMQHDDFDRVWQNLERLVELRDRKKSPMKITTHIMHFKGVEGDFAKFKTYWEPKLDGVVLRPVGNWGSDDLGLMRRLAERGFLSAHNTPAQRYPCTSIFMHMKLQYDGNYFPCVAAIPAFDRHLVPPLGNAREITWSEAWRLLGEMRRAHLEARWDEYECCRSCNIWSMWDNMWLRETHPDGAVGRFHLGDVELAE
jgi:MoaA/NifB/PqqE/SkfB family radical SAM enzyme